MKKLVLLIGFATLTMNAQVPSYIPTDGLVGYWPFSGNATKTIEEIKIASQNLLRTMISFFCKCNKNLKKIIKIFLQCQFLFLKDNNEKLHER